jgi:hypothetical protein
MGEDTVAEKTADNNQENKQPLEKNEATVNPGNSEQPPVPPVNLQASSETGQPASQTDGEAKSVRKTPKQRVVIVSLLSDEDHYRNLEDALPSGMVITRSLRSVKLRADLMTTFADVLSVSKEFVNFEEKLFGPQENEIGESGMNPLRYA